MFINGQTNMNLLKNKDQLLQLQDQQLQKLAHLVVYL
jgi:hypothetical protein